MDLPRSAAASFALTLVWLFASSSADAQTLAPASVTTSPLPSLYGEPIIGPANPLLPPDSPTPESDADEDVPLVLLAAKLLTAAREGDQVIDRGALVMEDGRITWVGTVDELEQRGLPDDARVRDLGDLWLMPGMIELHGHTGSGSVLERNDINSAVFQTNPGLRASVGVIQNNRLNKRGVAAGVTTMLHIPGSSSNIGGQGVLFKLGFDGYEESVLRDPGSLKLAQAGNPEDWAYRMDHAMMNWNTRNTFRRGLAYAARWREYERGEGERPNVDPQWEVFRSLAAGRAQVSTHTQMFQVVLTTLTMVRIELGLDVFIDHGTFDGYRAAGLAQEAGVPAILGPRKWVRSLARFGLCDTDGALLGVPAEFQKRGHTTIGFNTDSIDDDTLDLTPTQEELSVQAGLAVRYGFEEQDQLLSVRGLTIVPAIAVGLADRIGSLEPGKDADVIAITGHPGDARSSVESVWVDGESVYDAERDGRRW